MKNYLRFLSPVMLLLMAVMFGGGKILAQTANLTFSAKCGGKGTDNQKGAWVISSDGTESDFDSDRGIHYGTKKADVSYITATTKAYSTKTITKIVVNASAVNAGSPKVSCTVGGVSFGTEQALTNTNTPYTFEGTATGDIVVKVSKNKTKKALYLKSIEVTYKEDDGKTQTTLSFGETYDGKTINVNLGDEFTAPTATLTPNIESAAIKYSSSKPAVATVDETTGAVTIVGAGTTGITATFAGDDTYAASKASYTINVINVIKSIADLKQQLDNNDKTFTLKLTDAVVSYVYGDRAYLEDASAGILVFLKGSQTLVAGQKFNGLVEVAAQTWHNLPEITSWTASPSMTTETVTELPLEVVTVEELKNNYKKYEGRRVKVLGVTITKIFTSDDLSGEITQNGLSITLRAGDNPIETTLNDIVNVIGFPTIYNTGKQLAIWEQSAIDVINTETLTTSAGGYATYSADYAVNYSDLGLTAYTLTVDESKNTVTAKEFTGVVPAGGAVLVKGDASKAYTLTPATTEGDATFATDLKTGATKADGTQYGFTSKSGTPAFAQVVSGQDIPAKKGYIVLSGASAAKYSICFDDEATGIQTIEAASAANATMYNLAGQRVDKAYKGIVIVNGKKYLNK